MRFSFSRKYLSRKINGTFCIKVILNRNDSMLKVNVLKAYKHIKAAQNFHSVQPRIIKKSKKWFAMQVSELIFIK